MTTPEADKFFKPMTVWLDKHAPAPACKDSLKLADHDLYSYPDPKHLLTLPDKPGQEAALLLQTDACVNCGMRVVMTPDDYEKRHEKPTA